MIRVIILHYLNIKPTHGYEIQQFISMSGIDQWTKIQSGSIYYALTKLEKEKNIAIQREERTGSRVRKIYAITEQGKNTLFLIEHGIPCINAHTNLDLAPGGVNDTLANVLGLEDVKVVNPVGTDSEGHEYGLLRQGVVAEQPLELFLQRVKDVLGCPGLRYADGGKPVRKVCVGGGACGSELMDAYRAGCDTFVTADVKYNQFWDAKDLGMTIIDAGHFFTENPVVQVLADKIQTAFPDIQVVVSKTHTDCAKFF